MQLSGSITALATPFAPDGALDLAALDRLLDRQLEAGTAGLVIAGSTGEAAMLEDAEFATLLQHAARRVDGRVPLLAGCGLSGTARTIAQTRRARDCGIDAALVVTPPYVRPTQDGLVTHFTAVAAEGGLPVVLYNVPGRTGCDLLPETVARLHEVPGIVGIKEARPERERMRTLLASRRPGFAVLSGDDPSALQSMLDGADGVISVVSNLVPAGWRRLCSFARRGDGQAGTRLREQLEPLIAFCGVEPNPIPVKALLAELGLCADVVRAPLLPLSAVYRARLPELTAAVRAAEAVVQPFDSSLE